MSVQSIGYHKTPDILMLKNILYLANFCLHLESFESTGKALEMGYSCANHLMTASQDFQLSLSRNHCSLCPVTHCAPSSPTGDKTLSFICISNIYLFRLIATI
jgi:hypothetical protein